MKKILLTSLTLLTLVGISSSVHAAATVTYTTLPGTGADALIQDTTLPNDDIIAGTSATVNVGTLSAGTIGSLTDGLSSGNGTTGGNNAWLLNFPITFTYNLTGSATGYDITSISSIAGWQNNDDASQDFTVYYTTTTNSAFQALGTYSLDLSDKADSLSTQVLVDNVNGSNVADGAAFLTNVTALEFAYTHGNSDSDGGTILHELDVDGVASSAAAAPEPSTYAMMLTGLVALGFMVRRKLA